MPEQNNWKEELKKEIFVYEDKYKNTTVGHYAKLQEHMESFISFLLSSQAHALKEQMKACVPEEKNTAINSNVPLMHVNKGFNQCREQTLSAIESIEI